MLRRLSFTLGTLALAGTMALVLPTSASAATGVLVINGKRHVNPSGCFWATSHPLAIQNRTNAPAFVFDRPGCGGQVTDVVRPGGSTISEFGNSVFVR